MRGPGAGWVTIVLVAVCAQAQEAGPEFFAARVQPVLVERCLECHGADRKGELDLRSKASLLRGGESGPAVEPGNVAESLLVDYVESGLMPPKGPLSVEEVDALKRWIADGAFFPDEPLDPLAVTTSRRAGYDWWSLRPLSDTDLPVPAAIPDTWQHHPIDRFVYRQLLERGLTPSPPADRRTLIRRATYNLTGLPPTREEIEQFIHDPSPDAYERLIDRLLESPHYGEHWGRHWLDVVRFGESNGFERNEIINNAWPYRDYVIDSLNADKPFDQFTLEQLAGDVIGADQPRTAVGTTFLVCGPYDDVTNLDAEQAAQIRADTLDDMIRATGETFLGLTIGCSRCHDHKFDPISQRDYYALYATFAGVRHGSREVGSQQDREEREQKIAPLREQRGAVQREADDLERSVAERGEREWAARGESWPRPPISRRGVEEQFAPVTAQYVRLVVEGLDTNPRATTGFRVDEFEVWTAEPTPRNVALASLGGRAFGQSHQPGDFATAYSADLVIDGQFGAHWIAAAPELIVQLAEPTLIDRVLFSSDRTGAAGDHPIATFVCEYHLEISNDREQWIRIAGSRDRQPVSDAHRRQRLIDATITLQERQKLAELRVSIADLDRQIAAVPALPSWWIGTFHQESGPFHVFRGGSPQKPGDEVTPASLSALRDAVAPYEIPPTSSESERRLALAQWLIHSDNPWPPRVLANRLWHYHFGTGIVDTPNDFGLMGGRPTHPELLDWLANRLHAHHWRLKPLHRLIMTSQTYRQSGAFRPEAAAVDSESRYLWRFPPRRLTAEEIRDTVLLVSGQLDRRRGGPGFRLYRYLQDNVATYVPLDTFGPDTYRRSVYHQNARATQIDLMTDFDAPDCALSAPRRAVTTTPLQALTMFNHQFTLDMARALAERIDTQLASDDGPRDEAVTEGNRRRVERAFELTLTRCPTTAEQTAGMELVARHGLPALCRALLNANELIHID